MVRYGRSRSFKVIEIGTNRKPLCKFLSSYIVTLSYIVYGQQIENWPFYPPVSFEALAQGVPLGPECCLKLN